uniref:ZNF468 protein n=1 Tax=Homo sapiens TaxID=9606 RepID=Q6P514_HUMAN
MNVARFLIKKQPLHITIDFILERNLTNGRNVTKVFSCKSNLKTHKKIHIEEKPYRGKVCDKVFAYNAYLAKHTRIHTGEKLIISVMSVARPLVKIHTL